MSYDSAAWGAFAAALTVLLGIVAWGRWRRSGLASGLNGAAWALVPVAAWLTGLLELAADVAGSVGDWALRLAFSPAVWLGVVLAGVSAVLFGASAVLGRRGGRRTPKVAQKVLPRSADALPSASRSTDGVDDEIEAILRRHGIS